MTSKKKLELSAEKPELALRPIYIRPHLVIRKCRFNPSFEGFTRLPVFMRNQVLSVHEQKHPDTALPPLEISQKRRTK